MKAQILVSSLAATFLAVAAPVQAELIFGLTTTGNIFRFDHATPGTVTGIAVITGASSAIVDIDFSPVSQLLYGIAVDGNFYSINTTTGAATLSIGVGSQIAPNTITAPTVIDFNPVADRLRVFQGTNNFRLTGDAPTFDSAQTAGTVSTDGAFSGVAGANLVAAAYTNNFNGSTSTTLYSLDTTADQLVIHSGAPQFSTLAAVGSLGVNIDATNVGFDISVNQGSTTGYVSNANSFYTINLSNGALGSATSIGTGAFTTRSIAAASVPEPTVAMLGAFGLLGLLSRRRRGV